MPFQKYLSDRRFPYSALQILVVSLSIGIIFSACSSEEDPTATAVPPTAIPPTPTTALPTQASEVAEPSGETTKIGTLMDATGDLGIFGPPMQTAVDLAVKMVNDAGGVNGTTLEVIHRDSATSEQIATDAANTLVNVDGVDAIIGSLSSGVTIAVAESVTIPGGALLISPASSSPAITVLDDNDMVFRTNVSDALQGVVVAALAEELGYSNVATTYINNAYGEGLTSVFEENFVAKGGTVSAQVGHESGQASYISELRRASEGGAEVLMAIAYPETAGVFLREAIEGDFFEQYLFVDATKSQDLFDTLGAEAFEGNYGTAPGAPDTPTKQQFLSMYRSMTDGDADSLFISEAFDAAVILALAIEHADSADGDAIKASIREVANAPGEKVGPGNIARALELVRSGQDIDYIGAAGDQDFDENGDVLNTIEVWRIVDGKITSTGIFARPGDAIDLESAGMTMMEQPTGEPTRIGTLIDTTGDLGIFGPPLQTAVDLLAELVNEAGGVNGTTLEIVHRDSATSEQIATDAASALVNVDGISAIIGSLSSGITLAVAESVTIPGGAVLISPASTSPALANVQDDDLLFRTAVSDALQGVIAATLANELGIENIATMYINNAYGEGLTSVFSENFEALGGTVSAQVGIEGGQATYLSELRKAADGGAEVLMAIAYPETAGVFLREAIEGGFFERYLFVDGTKNQELLDSIGAENFENDYGTSPGAPDTPTKQDFLSLYTSMTDGDADSLFISEAFDAAAVLALAIEHADSTDGDAIKASIREVANAPGEKVGPGDIARALELVRNGQDIDYVGAAGDQDFDENGDVLNTIEVWRIVDGKITSTGIFARPGDDIDIDAGGSMQDSSRGGDTAHSFTIGSGSQGLFKVDETLQGLDIVVALQTDALTGNIDLGSGNAHVAIDLHTLKSDQARRDRYVRERLFASQPVTTVNFDSLGHIPDSFYTSGEVLATTLTATVNVNGVDADIPFEITARLDNGENLVVLGKAEFVWADFGMEAPVSSFFSVRDDVLTEILLQATLDQ